MPAIPISKTERKRFDELADEWRNSQGVTSSLTQIALNPAYQQIVGMGESAVPCIFRELEKKTGSLVLGIEINHRRRPGI